MWRTCWGEDIYKKQSSKKGLSITIKECWRKRYERRHLIHACDWCQSIIVAQSTPRLSRCSVWLVHYFFWWCSLSLQPASKLLFPSIGTTLLFACNMRILTITLHQEWGQIHGATCSGVGNKNLITTWSHE